VPLSQPGVTRAVVGSALYLAVIGLGGLGLGALVRNAAGGIAALFGLLYGLPLAAGLLPGTWAADVSKYLPTTAGQAVTTVQPDPTLLQPWTGFGALCLYAAVLLGLAALRIRRGDA
jgi:ABC-2 type transport system permease protein